MTSTSITASEFYKVWVDIVSDRKEHLLTIWRNAKAYTQYIKNDENSVIREVAKRLNLLCYAHDYYSIDSILYKEEDRVQGLNPNSYWFRNIRVAFEHENNFKSGLYQEASHLLITNCDLRVLVSYPGDSPDGELKYLHEIVSGNRQAQEISDHESFLIIFGYEKDFVWEGYVFTTDSWKKLV
jgi:hypothetical protein